MTKEEIAKVLKESRIKAGFEAKEVAENLMEMNAIKSIKSFYNWETGRTQPDADTFMYLCNLYKVDNVMELFGYEADLEREAIDKEHCQLIVAYDNADLRDKNIARLALGLECLEEEKEEYLKIAGRNGTKCVSVDKAKAIEALKKDAEKDEPLPEDFI